MAKKAVVFVILMMVVFIVIEMLPEMEKAMLVPTITGTPVTVRRQCLGNCM